MHSRAFSTALAASCFALAAAGCGAIHHTPPGTSVKLALAKKAELVRMPTPPAQQTAASSASSGSVPAVEPALPHDDTAVKVADAYSRGQFCLQTGKDEEAITAFQEAVALDPKFADAWTSLAILYEKAGRNSEALDAFRKAKTLAQH